jgi:endonuclease/exonuclease/phosphatase family metal-dependent hydrolase
LSLRVLTWNLMHGRAVPPAGRNLFDDFAATLAEWSWDVALLQEVPPWWPKLLGTRLHADWRLVRTSRNALLPVRRAIAVRWPDLIKSNGGGANAIMALPERIVEHRMLRLCRRPERRWLHAVRLEGGLWVGNLHLTVHDDAAARREAELAATTMLAWANGAPALLGGDFNVTELALEGFEQLGGHDVDHVFGRGLHATTATQTPDRGRLSDHAPVLVTTS